MNDDRREQRPEEEEASMTTMDFDVLQKRWQAQDARLDAMLELNKRMLHSLERDQARGALDGVFRLLWMQFGIDLFAIVLLGMFLGNRVTVWEAELRFMVPAAVLFACAIAVFATVIRQLVMLYAIDSAGPVSEVQRRLEALYTFRLLVTRIGVLVASALWSPIVIVGLRALAGFDTYAWIPMPFLVFTFVFGALWIPVMYWVLRRYGPRFLHYPWVARFNEDLAGRGLSEARARLAELAAFQRDVE
jgi:hypothetical protein